jgi:hypothetical protein
VSAPVFDLLCALCFAMYTSPAFQRGARCGVVTDQVSDGCPGKLIEREPRSAKQPRREGRKRESVAVAEADEPAEAVWR